jgi:putative membrane protein
MTFIYDFTQGGLMGIVSRVLVVLVALEFFYIAYLEIYATTSQTSSKVFGLPESELARKSVSVLFKNQGVYNALIGVLLLINLFFLGYATGVVLLLVFIIAVAVYGALTSNPKILPMQGGLAIISLIFVLIFGI